MPDSTISIYQSNLSKFWVGLYLVILACSGATHFIEYGLGYDYAKGLVPMFKFDSELNVPTFLTLGMLFHAIIATWLVIKTDPPFKRSWYLLIFALVFVAFDEYASIHERLIDPMRALFSTSGFFYYAWIIPYGLAVIALGALMLKWFIKLSRETRNGYFLAAGSYLSAVILLEGFGGWYRSGLPDDNLIYALSYTVEESLEMLGIFIFTRTTFAYLQNHRGVRDIELRS